MDGNREIDEFSRIRINAKIERANRMLSQYRDGTDFWRQRLDTYHHLLGRIGQRLSEPEPEEP